MRTLEKVRRKRRGVGLRRGGVGRERGERTGGRDKKEMGRVEDVERADRRGSNYVLSN